MDKYWLDTNVLIEAKNGPYGFDMIPPFWPWILEKIKNGDIMLSSQVYDEVMKGDDELKVWMQDNELREISITPDEEAQKQFTKIADFTHQQFKPFICQGFLKGADPWVISQAKVNSGVVATREALVGNNSKKIKIPNICNQFDVRWIDSYQMIKRLGGLK